jgi:hypothetical protein
VCNVFHRGFNGKILEIHPVEDDAVIRGSGANCKADGSAGVKADSGKRDGSCQRMLMFQKITLE